ncbi:4012_t:CDS:1 [Paraglomus brasilianum]|uniref:4012_t:CDS:1 n=1 Tax=Paraglomus brasilianum TaxID=144538 RepID=A0A9N9H1P4_9GLOM|nr:4012_t:CDS:1 [Paraglomus brasilianum]
MDNATSHKKIDSLTSLTFEQHPCDGWGIISAFNSHYKLMFIQNRVVAYDVPMDNNTESTPFTIKDAIYTVANAWDRVSQQVIVNCWQKTRILFSTNDEIEETERAFEEEWVDNCVSMERLFN